MRWRCSNARFKQRRLSLTPRPPLPLVLSLLLACVDADSGFVATEDTSYPGRPELQAVSATCVEGLITFQARTVGWSNLAGVDVWYTPSVPDRHEVWTLPTTAYRRDEYCDFMELKLNSRGADTPDGLLDPSIFRCNQFVEPSLTFLFQVWYEDGCAGAQVFGAHPDAVYTDTQSVDVAPMTGPSDVSCVPENALDTEHIKGVVMTEVPPCSEPLE